MPDLSFRIGEVHPLLCAATPAIAAPLHIANADARQAIQSILLNCQVQIQPLGRPYSAEEEARLLDLFGERDRWGTTMKPLHWINLVVRVPPFRGETTIDLHLPCSHDFDLAANKYFYGLHTGFVAVTAMFSGTVFYADQGRDLQIAPIPWNREARFQLPVDVWKAAVDAHYAGSVWLRLPRDAFDRLYHYKVANGIPMWEDVVARLLRRTQPSDGTALETIEKSATP